MFGISINQPGASQFGSNGRMVDCGFVLMGETNGSAASFGDSNAMLLTFFVQTLYSADLMVRFTPLLDSMVSCMPSFFHAIVVCFL